MSRSAQKMFLTKTLWRYNGGNIQKYFCQEFHEMCRSAQKSHVWSTNPLVGQWGRRPTSKKCFVANFIIFSYLQKGSFPVPTPWGRVRNGVSSTKDFFARKCIQYQDLHRKIMCGTPNLFW